MCPSDMIQVAQLVERGVEGPKASGSNPLLDKTKTKTKIERLFVFRYKNNCIGIQWPVFHVHVMLWDALYCGAKCSIFSNAFKRVHMHMHSFISVSNHQKKNGTMGNMPFKASDIFHRVSCQ
jgi:hypothetical protein